jgi:hypothetical protein
MKAEPLAALQFMKPELVGYNIASSADWGFPRLKSRSGEFWSGQWKLSSNFK